MISLFWSEVVRGGGGGTRTCSVHLRDACEYDSSLRRGGGIRHFKLLSFILESSDLIEAINNTWPLIFGDMLTMHLQLSTFKLSSIINPQLFSPNIVLYFHFKLSITTIHLASILVTSCARQMSSRKLR